MKKFFFVTLFLLLISSTSFCMSAASYAVDDNFREELYKVVEGVRNYFGIDAEFFYDEDNPRVNATSSSTGEIHLFGGLVEKAYSVPNSPWTYIILVIAHEWAHQQQFLYGYRPMYNIQKELQADCEGAYFLFTIYKVTQEEITNLINNQMSNPIRSLPWWDVKAHGTRQQRIAAVKRGYDLASHAISINRMYTPSEIFNFCEYIMVTP
ncbi:MAG: hypothetical protein HQK51_10120 [Oligoflexia bacterium]|nr:hypothetical protein [Oligoflexia bacterium]